MHRNDSTREWLTYISVFVVMMAILSNIHSIGTLFPYLLEEFGENRANTVAIQSVFFGVGLCSGNNYMCCCQEFFFLSLLSSLGL